MSWQHWQDIFAGLLDGAAEAGRSIYQLAVCLPDETLSGTVGLRVEGGRQNGYTPLH